MSETPGDDRRPSEFELLLGLISDLVNERDVTTNPALDADMVDKLGADQGIGLDPTLIEAYLTTNNELHGSGLRGFDTATLLSVNEGKSETVTALARTYAVLSDPARYFKAEYGAIGGRVARMMRGKPDWQSEEVRIWMHGVELQRNQGIRATPALRGMATLARFVHSPELGLDHPYTPHPRDRQQAVDVFGESVLWASVPTNVACSRLREVGVVDASQARLDTRVENLLRVMQVETTSVVLRALEDMWTAGGACREAAVRLFAKHRNQILTDDLPAKEAMTQEIEGVLARLLERGRFGAELERDFLEVKRSHLAQYLFECRSVRQMCVTVYENTPYDVPASLQPPKAAVHEETGPAPAERVELVGEAAGNLAVGDEKPGDEEPPPPPPELNPAVLEGFRTRAAELTARAGKVNQAWTMSNQDRNTTGLGEAVRAATRGCDTTRGQFLISRRQPAEELVAVFRRFVVMGGREPATAQKQLAAALGREQALVDDIAALRAEMRETDPTFDVELPAVVRVSDYIGRLREDWRYWRSVVIGIWPNNQLREALENLEQLAFPPAPPEADSVPPQ